MRTIDGDKTMGRGVNHPGCGYDRYIVLVWVPLYNVSAARRKS
jgi:hypothetical protein